jgi:hypothetical protein
MGSQVTEGIAAAEGSLSRNGHDFDGRPGKICQKLIEANFLLGRVATVSTRMLAGSVANGPSKCIGERHLVVPARAWRTNTVRPGAFRWRCGRVARGVGEQWTMCETIGG